MGTPKKDGDYLRNVAVTWSGQLGIRSEDMPTFNGVRDIYALKESFRYILARYGGQIHERVQNMEGTTLGKIIYNHNDPASEQGALSLHNILPPNEFSLPTYTYGGNRYLWGLAMYVIAAEISQLVFEKKKRAKTKAG